MAHSKGEIKPGRAHTKVDGDDTMLRTGFVDGTPLEGGKIADSHRVDLFAAARRVADADPYNSQQQQEQRAADDDEGATTTATNKNHVIAESEPVDLPASARGVAEANPNPSPNHAAAATAATEQRRRQQGVAEQTGAGGRRLGLGRPGPV